PQLIAGPIVHHKKLIPQFAKQNISRLNAHNVAVGITIFSIGFFKKIIIADPIAQSANAMFSAAAGGAAPDVLGAWMGALAYTLQLYFDFSGYSDMAIGVAYLLGIRLPVNFNSPYRAKNISDFWRRWHITLSNFLRDYLYIPLGGNRKGIVRQNINLIITMLLGGLWHGAGWTFVVWGALHGFYLVVNNQWQSFKKHTGIASRADSWLVQRCAQLLTFLAVVVGWVFFRAQDLSTALVILHSMIGGNGISLPASIAGLLGPVQTVLASWNVAFTSDSAMIFATTWLRIFVLLAVVWLAPNTQTLIAAYLPENKNSENQSVDKASPKPEQKQRAASLQVKAKTAVWKPTTLYAVICGIMLFISTKSMLAASESAFLYFNF
ncbi:MAG: MBOAT family O-acyltransferase, partial [Cyanobacteria bacterium J06627_28]